MHDLDWLQQRTWILADKCFATPLLLLLSHFSCVWLCATPQTAAHQAPQSLGFSRQEHWSGLPFPSPIHESEKWKWSRSVMSYPQRPHGLQCTRLLRPWDFPGKSSGVGCHCLLHATPHMSENDYKSTATIDFGVVYNLDSRLIYKNEIHE